MYTSRDPKYSVGPSIICYMSDGPTCLVNYTHGAPLLYDGNKHRQNMVAEQIKVQSDARWVCYLELQVTKRKSLDSLSIL